MSDADSIELTAQRLKSALEDADLEGVADLLDPFVTWGPADVASPPCQNKQQVLAWYQKAASAGASATVSEFVVSKNHIMVGLVVSGVKGPRNRGGAAPRWQVYTVRDGLIVDIVGFDTRSEAAQRARLVD